MYLSDKSKVIIFAVFLLVLTSLFFLPPQKQLTGAVAFEQSELSSVIVNSTFNESTTLDLNLTNISSLKISGKFQGESARVYADINSTLSLIFDSNSITNHTFSTSVETTSTNSSTEAIYFSDQCAETCNLKMLSPKLLIVLRGNTELTISNVTYAAQPQIGELKQIKQIPDVSITGEGTINLSEFFTETNNAPIRYAITPMHDVRAIIFEDTLNLFARKPGTYFSRIMATNGEQMITSNEFSIIVGEKQKSKVDDDVEEKLQLNDEIPVIIELNKTTLKSSDRKKSGLREQKEAFHKLHKIKTAENKNHTFSASVETTSTNSSTEANSFSNATVQKDYDYEIEADYDNLPLIAVRLTKQGIDKLKADSSISAIHLDKNLTISLQDSIPLVRANLAQNLSYSNTQILGQGQTLCILDTGVDANHTAFQNRVMQGKNFIANNDNTSDDNGHGTHVAGIAAANGTIIGVAPRANILPVKICDVSGNCPSSAILAGLDYCINKSNELNISSISGSFADGGEYNKTNCPTFFDAALRAANEQNITNVFASGNNYYQNGISYPACSPFSIAVGASTKQDALAMFTNRGDALDILAPGADITSTLPNNQYGAKSGTSMSTAFVSATVSLIAQKQKLQNFALSPAQIEQLLKDTADANSAGIPRLNVFNAVSRAGEIVVNITPPIFNSTEIIFKEPVDWTNFSACSNISFNHAEIYSDSCSEYNKSAHIVLKGLQWTDAWPLRDGVECAGISCFNITYTYGTLSFDVNSFSTYSAGGSGELTFTQQQIGLPTIEPPFFFGNGENGSLNISAGTTVILNTSTTGPNPSHMGGYNFTSLVIAVGGTLTVATDNISAPLLIRVLGDVNISGNITIAGQTGAVTIGGCGIANGSCGGSGGVVAAGAGSAGRGLGGGAGGAGAVTSTQNGSGGAGGGYATAGGAGGNRTIRNAGGASYNNENISSPDIDGVSTNGATGGSGGGGGGANNTVAGAGGGGGGGAIKIIAGGTMIIGAGAKINASGGRGGSPSATGGGGGVGCGGGGSGGTIILAAPRIVLSGVLNVSGGKGGIANCRDKGGNASAGRIKLYYENLTISGGRMDLEGNGSAAGNVGGRGTNVSFQYVGCGQDIYSSINITHNITCQVNASQYGLRLQMSNTTTTNPGIPVPYLVDCGNLNITGNGSGIGIVVNTSNVQLQRCNVNNWSTGLQNSNTTNATMIGLTFFNNTIAINISDDKLGQGRESYTNITISNSIYGILMLNGGNQTFQTVNITHNESGTYGIIMNSVSNATFHNLTIGDFIQPLLGTSLTIINSTGITFNNSVIGNYSIEKSNLTFEQSGFGKISFTRNITQTSNTNLTGLSRPTINISSNLTFVNTTNQQGFNVTANLTFFGLTGFTNPQAIVSFNDAAVFEKCDPTICSAPLYNAVTGTVQFQVTQFTTYAVNETPATPSACGRVNSSLNLNRNVDAAGGSCFDFNQSNVLFDCAGYNITSNPQGVVAFNLTTFVVGTTQINLSNITIRNCNIQNFSVGINVSSAVNVSLLNINITNVTAGIWFNNTATSIISGNTINATTGNGIYLTNSSNNTIIANNVSNNGGTEAALVLNNSDNNFVSNNFAFSSGNPGIIVREMSINNFFLNNSATSINDHGILVSSSANNTFVFNNFQSLADEGFSFKFSDNNTLVNNSLFGLINALKMNNSHANTFFNNTFNGTGAVFLQINNQNVNFTNNTLIGNTAFEINASTNISITTTIFQNTNYSIKTDLGSNISLIDNQRMTNYTFANTPNLMIHNSQAGMIQFFNIINANGTNLSMDVNLTTNRIHVNSSRSNGLNTTANITFFNQIFTTIQVSFDDVTFNDCPADVCSPIILSGTNTLFNVSHFTTFRGTSNAPTACGRVNSSVILTSNIVATGGSCFDFNQSNILFDCRGFNISSNQLSRSAFNITTFTVGTSQFNLSNIIIQNCNILTNFSEAINVSSAENISLLNNNITQTITSVNYNGIRLNNTLTSVLINNKINTTVFGIYMLTSVNNTLENNTAHSIFSNGIALSNSTKNVLKNNTASGDNAAAFAIGINSSNNLLINDTGIANSDSGFLFTSLARNNTLINSTGKSNSYINLLLTFTENNTIINNTFQMNSSASVADVVYLLNANYNTFIDNKILALGTNSRGIEFCCGLNFNNKFTQNIIINNNTAGVDSSAIVMYDGASNNTFTSNIIKSVDNYGMTLTDTGNPTKNPAVSTQKNIFINNTFQGYSVAILTYFNATNDLFINNTIVDSNTGFEINASTNISIINTSFQNVNWSIKTGLGTNVSLIDNERMTNYSFKNAPRITITDTGIASVTFFNIVSANGTNLSQDVNLTSNDVFVNTSRSRGLNLTANITIFNLAHSNILFGPQVDFYDLGSFTNCSSPRCTVLDTTGTSVIFNVSSFTTYRIGNTCGKVNESVTLSSNVVQKDSAATCFDFNQSNILFDCAGYNITSNPQGVVAFNLTTFVVGTTQINLSNITIRNCNIQNFSIGINVSSAVNISLLNNSVKNGTNGIWFNNTATSIISGNVINATTGNGIYLTNSSNNTIIANNVSNNGGTEAALVLNNSNNNFVSNNFAFSSGNPGIIAREFSVNNFFLNNSATSINDHGILVSSSANNTFVFNNVQSLADEGFSFKFSDNNTLVNNSLFGAINALKMNNSNANTFFNNTFNGTGAVFLQINNQNVNFTNNTLIGNTAFEINTSNNILITNTTFQNTNYSIKTSLGSNVTLVDNERMTNYSFNNIPSLTITKTGMASVNFFNIINANGTNLSRDINLSTNFTRVNTTKSPGLNVTANITFYNVTGFINPQIIVDYADLGNFQICSQPSCTILIPYASNSITFNVSGFTTYAINETFSGGNIPPTINKVWFDNPVTPQENVKTGFNITINFTANDADGSANLADASAIAYITNNTIVKASSPVNCTVIANNATSKNYSCQINITYYQPAGVWNITVNITDAANAMATNGTTQFTLNALTAISLNTSDITFANIQPGTGNQKANRGLGIDNTGNINITTLDFKAFDVWNLSVTGTPLVIINASNFTVSVHELATGPPATLRNNTLVTLTNSSVPVDSDAGDSGNRTLYFFVNVSNILPGNYNASRFWEVSNTP